MSGSPGPDRRFDFRAAVIERERAIRALEALLHQSTESGEEPDRQVVSELIAMITGRRPGRPPERGMVWYG
jgi:hypothetical protein